MKIDQKPNTKVINDLKCGSLANEVITDGKGMLSDGCGVNGCNLYSSQDRIVN